MSGELSNNGQAMRRFMQTFILAPQTPKKYYVHNDIFRYQDEVFHDETDIPGEPRVSSCLNRAIVMSYRILHTVNNNRHLISTFCSSSSVDCIT